MKHSQYRDELIKETNHHLWPVMKLLFLPVVVSFILHVQCNGRACGGKRPEMQIKSDLTFLHSLVLLRIDGAAEET